MGEVVSYKKKKRKTNPMAYAFILPTLVLFGIFVVWPLIQTVYLSFNSWNGIGAIEFVGLSKLCGIFHRPTCPSVGIK